MQAVVAILAFKLVDTGRTNNHVIAGAANDVQVLELAGKIDVHVGGHASR